MTFLRSVRVAAMAGGLFLMCVVAAPMALAAVPNRDHPSSDAPWLIAILVLVVLGIAAVGLLFRRKVTKTSGTDFKR